MNKYIVILLMVFGCVLSAMAETPVCIPPNDDVTKNISAEEQLLIQQHQQEVKEKVEKEREKTCTTPV